MKLSIQIQQSKKSMFITGGIILLAVLAMTTIYTVNEGNVGIVKRFSKVIYQVKPGLHFKVPFIDGVRNIEVRPRRNVEKMASSTKEQMPVTIDISVTWTVDRSRAIDLYREYGGLDQFESRILDTKFRSTTKSVIPKFTAEQLIRDRSTAIMGIEAALLDEMDGFPVAIDNVQIDNITLPPVYIKSIQTKQTEKNLAEAEKHKLERQRLEALRGVNTADAKAQGILKVAEAEAKAMILKGEAEAEAITAKAEALKGNPLIIDLTKAKKWNGTLPTTMLSDVMPMIKIDKD